MGLPPYVSNGFPVVGTPLEDAVSLASSAKASIADLTSPLFSIGHGKVNIRMSFGRMHNVYEGGRNGTPCTYASSNMLPITLRS